MKKVVYGVLILVVLIVGYVVLVDLLVDDEVYRDEEALKNVQYSGFVIEEKVDSPDECVEFEKYDTRRGVCFFQCDTQEQCDEMEAKLDLVLDELEDEYGEFAQNFKEFKGDVGESIKKAEIVYEVQKGEKFVVVKGAENQKHIKIRKWLADISPDKFSDAYLARLIILTDTEDDSAAYVAPSDVAGKWDMFVNVKSMDEDGEKEMVFTLIHEYAHILTLNSSQVVEETSETACQNYFVQEGCTNKNAYLNLFYFKFWDGKGFELEPEDSLDNYDKAPKSFVTQYAATNPGEDIAESFASFIFKKEKSVGTIADQKVTFFYAYVEFLEARNVIREALSPIVRKRVIQ